MVRSQFLDRRGGERRVSRTSCQPSTIGSSTPRPSANTESAGAGLPDGKLRLSSRARQRGSTAFRRPCHSSSDANTNAWRHGRGGRRAWTSAHSGTPGAAAAMRASTSARAAGRRSTTKNGATRSARVRPRKVEVAPRPAVTARMGLATRPATAPMQARRRKRFLPGLVSTALPGAAGGSRGRCRDDARTAECRSAKNRGSTGSFSGTWA